MSEAQRNVESFRDYNRSHKPALSPSKPPNQVGEDVGMSVEASEAGKGERLPGMKKEYSGWDVYNNEAKKVDTELISDWRASLNSLLVFSAIFSAVLTGFIIESKKTLEQDSAGIMLEVMILFTNNMANGTHTPWRQSDFQPKPSDVTVNCLLFASLTTSLAAALASVIALQWAAEYDAAITRGGSSPEDRAKRRQFRYAGVVWWRMSEIIAALPLLLYASVFLFLSGLILWIWLLHRIVGIVVATGASTAVIFYGTSTAVGVASASAPFQTPFSRWIYSFSFLLPSSAYRLATALGLHRVSAWFKDGHLAYGVSHQRRDLAVEEATGMKSEAIAWAASQVTLSLDSYRRFMLLANELPGLNADSFTFLASYDAPWWTILDMLGWKLLRIAQERQINSKELRDFEVLSRCYQLETVKRIVGPQSSQMHGLQPTSEEYWSQNRSRPQELWDSKATRDGPNSLLLLLRDTPAASSGDMQELMTSAQLACWRNSVNPDWHVWEEVFAPANKLSPSFLASCLMSFSHFVGAQKWRMADDERRERYVSIAHQIVHLLDQVGGDISLHVLKSLSRCFESLVTGYREGDDASKWFCEQRKYAYRICRLSKGSQALHSDFLLLLAMCIQWSPDEDALERVQEVITMLWIAANPDVDHEPSLLAAEQINGDFNEELGMSWILHAHRIPLIRQVLPHLARVQDKIPEIGPLWRLTRPNGYGGLFEVFQTFDRLMEGSCSPAEHFAMVRLVCHEMESNRWPTEETVTEDQLAALSNLRDPCLSLLGACMSHTIEKYDIMPTQEQLDCFRDSWTRTEEYLLRCQNPSASPSLVAFLWHLLPDTSEICKRALGEPEAFAYLRRVFDHPVRCSNHDSNVEGHLLLHIFGPLPGIWLPDGALPIGKIHDDMTNGQVMVDPLLALLFLCEEHTPFLRGQLTDVKRRFLWEPEIELKMVHADCITQLVEICCRIVTSQYSCLLLLLNHSPDLVVSHFQAAGTADLAVMLRCIDRALALDPVAASTPILYPLARELNDLFQPKHITREYAFFRLTRQHVKTTCGVLTSMFKARGGVIPKDDLGMLSRAETQRQKKSEQWQTR